MFAVIKFNDSASWENIIYNFLTSVATKSKLATLHALTPHQEENKKKPQTSSLNEMEVN